jgi:hypothetical protein
MKSLRASWLQQPLRQITELAMAAAALDFSLK